MYLVTIRMSLPDLHPDQRLEKRYGMAQFKELADWWHTFKRTCEASGWRKMPMPDATAPEEFRRHGLERRMCLTPENGGRTISVTIDVLEPVNAHQAAKSFIL